MENSKLIILFKNLSVWEIKSFEKYVLSPFVNVNEDVIRLNRILIKLYPEFNEDKISLKKINQQLFGSKSPSLQKLRYVMTDLTRLLEGFLVQLSLDENGTVKKQLLLKKLRERNIDKFFRQHLDESIALHANGSTSDIYHLKNKFDFNEMGYEFHVVKDNRGLDNRLQQLSDNLDHYYLVKKLKYSCEMLNRQNILNVNYDLSFLEHLLSYVEKQKFTEPIISIYYTILLTIKDSNKENHYKTLKSLLAEHHSGFSLKELRDMYAFAQNYCIRKVNTGKTEYLQELFDLYTFQLEKKINFDNGELSHADFKNIVAIALRLNEFAWTEKFITDFAKFLNKDLRKNSVNYNMARLHFSRKEYKQAIKLLTAVEFTDVYYHLDSKSLLLKVYYETEEFEPLFSLISTFKIYLKRSKLISDYQRNTYKNLLQFVKPLAQIKSGDKKPLQKIKAEIAAEPNIADTGWLQSKLAELE